MSLVVDEHRQYLADPVRLDAFERAIRTTVKPGDVVADVGSGTGVLAFLACRAGAARVYAIESTGMIEVARTIAAANRFSDRITFISRHSTEVTLPEPAAVVVGDLAGRMGFDAGVFETFRDALRFVSAGGRAVPSAVTINAGLVEHQLSNDEAHFWSAPVASLDVSPVLEWSLNTGYPRRFERADLLSDASVHGTFDTFAAAAVLRISGTIPVMRAGTLHGLAGWFTATLAPGVEMTNSPLAGARINRRNVFLPLEKPIAVVPGDSVDVDIRIRPAQLIVLWDVEVRTAATVRHMRHSTLKGMLIARDELRTHEPSSRPQLTTRGIARRTVLELCDGRALVEIEHEVFARHRSLFRDLAEAQAFVSEVVSRYSELA
jgi:protein arginine N-methyltransferase 1